MPKIIQKQNDNTKYNRINQIYSMLKNNVHGFTINELAKELDVSTKTIHQPCRLINIKQLKQWIL